MPGKPAGKPGPPKGSPKAKADGKQGGKSMPSRKRGRHKVGVRHGKPGKTKR